METSVESDPEEELLFLPPSPLNKNMILEISPCTRYHKYNDILGSGAFKTVYRGFDTEIGCEVAWNVICTGSLQLHERPKLLEEIRLNQSLHHPNIISYMDSWTNAHAHELIFITELATGGSLSKFLKSIKNPSLTAIRHWCIGILKGLKYLHANNIVHRDLKPDNVFVVSSTGDMKIGDFGLSASIEKTQAKSVVGTPQYMAPEVLDGAYGTEVDIYGFGMCLLEIVTLSTPFKECATSAGIIKKKLLKELPAAFFLIKDAEVKELVAQCLGDVGVRPSAGELLNHPFFLKEKQHCSFETGFVISLTMQVDSDVFCIEFSYDQEKDTPEDVARELVSELHLEPTNLSRIAEMLREKVRNSAVHGLSSSPYDSTSTTTPEHSFISVIL